MQVLEKPRLITEQEDVHLIETFLIGTKPNKAGWTLSKNAKTDINEWVGRDFVIIPEKIFDLSQRQPGHTDKGTFDSEMAEAARHSNGKITKVKGPIKYDDGSDDYYYNAIVRLSGSKSAAALREHGSNTWVPFAVSPTIWPEEGDDDNITRYRPMGLFLVIEGAYGEKAVVEKMCSGSALKCGTSLSAAIENLNHDTTDQQLSEVLSSYISNTDKIKIAMSQTQELQKPVENFTVNTPVQAPVQPEKVELKKDEKITFTKEEYDAIQKEKEASLQLANEVAELKKERDQNILNSVFGTIEKEEERTVVFEKYMNKDTKLVKQVYEDIIKYVLPKKIEEAKNVKVEEKKVESRSASVLKPEPRIDKNESLSASVQTDDISISECRSILGL